MSQASDTECDVLIVGSGAAGLVAAISAVNDGLKPLVIEKAALWGGTSAMSGGGMWIPANNYQKAAGIQDSFEDAMTFLEATIPDAGPASSRERKAALCRTAPEMIRFIASKGVKMWKGYLYDYHAKQPGARPGRHVEPLIFDLNKLGRWRETMRLVLLSPYPVFAEETPRVAAGNVGTMAKLFLRYYFLRLLGQRPVGMGASLTAQLMAAALRANVPVRLNCPLREVLVEDNRAVGGVVEVEGKRQVIKARVGVLLCAGGFAHAPEFRKAHQGITGEDSNASPDDTGDIIKMADELGVETALMDDGWWFPAVHLPNGEPYGNPSDRSLPGSIMVGSDGRRFTNESQNYTSVGHDMIKKGLDDPTWVIIDSRHRKKYMLGAALPGRETKKRIECGLLFEGGTLEELARKIGVDPSNLRDTVARFNKFADAGVDEDFQRGGDNYDPMYGDENHKPNTNLGRIDQPPYYATRMYLGDLGTKGGLLTDEYARVVRKDGRVIEGLYGAGNTTASVMGRRYPGPGSTLGPALTFAYIAARHMASRSSNQIEDRTEAAVSA